MLRLYNRAAYHWTRPTLLSELGRGFDTTRERFGVKAPPAALYLSQAPSWVYDQSNPRSKEFPAKRLGYRAPLVEAKELLDPIIFLCGGSGSLKYGSKT